MIAAGRFDPPRERRFSTYAFFWMKHKVLRLLQKTRREREATTLRGEAPASRDHEALDRRLDVAEALRPLAPRQRLALAMRFGLFGAGEHRLREVAVVLGVSRQRAKQLADEALDKLRSERTNSAASV